MTNSLPLRLLPPPHRPCHQIPGFVPANPQNLPRPMDVRLFQNLYPKTLKKNCKSRFFLRSPHLHLFHSMIRALDPRNSRMKKCLKLAGVQMSPDPLGSMTINRQHPLTLRARPSKTFRMTGPDVNSLPGNIQLHSLHFPRFLKTQNIPISSVSCMTPFLSESFYTTWGPIKMSDQP